MVRGGRHAAPAFEGRKPCVLCRACFRVPAPSCLAMRVQGRVRSTWGQLVCLPSARTATTPGGPCGLARPAPRLVLPVGSDRVCGSKCHCIYPVLGCRRVVARRCVAGPASGPSPRCSAAPRSMPPCRCIAPVCHRSVLARCSALCVSAHVPCNVLHRSVQHTLRAQIYQYLIAGCPETGPERQPAHP